jgi:HEAT repeat protein
MTALLALVTVAVLAAIVVYVVRRRKHGATLAVRDEFSTLSEAERCDYVFALGALDDPATMPLLRRALEDPSETVAIAAARSLVTAGRNDELETFLAHRSDDRSRQIAQTLELLA